MIFERYRNKLPFLEKTWFQFIVFVLRRFKADRCQDQAGSLTYTTLFAVVPMLTGFSGYHFLHQGTGTCPTTTATTDLQQLFA